MLSWVWYLVFGIILVVVLVLAIVIRKTSKKLEKKFEKENKQSELAMTEALNKSQQHLKYKPKIKVIYFIGIASISLSMLTMILYYFLPIFQIKTELMGITLVEKNFSIFDNLIENIRLGKDFSILDSAIFLFTSLIVICAIIGFVKNKKRFSDADSFVLDCYKNMKLYESYTGDLLDVGVSLGFAIGGIGAETLLGFIIGTKYEWSKYFELCNSVSGYIAIPIICFSAAVGLKIWSSILKKKLIAEIKAEIVDIPTIDVAPPQTEETPLSQTEVVDLPKAEEGKVAQTAEVELPQTEEGIASDNTVDTPKDKGVGEPTDEEKKE